MSPSTLEFAPTVHFVRRPGQSLIVELRSRRWVRISTRGLEAVEARLAGVAAGDGPPDASTNGRPDPRQVEAALDFLREHGFLAGNGTAAATEAAATAEPAAADRTLHLHVTHHCNLECPTCYASDFLRHGPDVLTLADLDRVMRVAAETGFRRLTLSGGEPLLRRDLAELLDLGRARFHSVSLTTNGTALTARKARQLVGRVDHVNVSVEGVCAEVHDAVRGPGAFDRVMRGLRTLLDAGFPATSVSLTPTVTRLNHGELDRMVDLAAELDTDVAFGFFMPTGRGLCNRERLTVDPADMVALFERAAARRRQSRGLPAVSRPGEDPELAFPRVCTDCAVDTIVTVQADGSVFPCPNLIQPEHRLGNVLEVDDAELARLLDGGEGKEPYRRRVVDRVAGCRGCEARYFCGGGCMANAYMVTGDLYGRDPYCAFYQEMWRRHGPLQEEYATRQAATQAGTQEGPRGGPP